MEEGGYYDGLTTFPFAFFVSLLQRQTYSIDIGWAWGLWGSGVRVPLGTGMKY